jgi:hypothetical protein
MAKRKPKPAKSATAQAVTQEYRKPQADLYTLLLVVALLMLILATAILWMTMKEYDYQIKGGPNPTWNLPAFPTTINTQHAVA